jgi:hypothetical protein
VHPIERLRYVARSSGADHRLLVRETAQALRGLGAEPHELVVSARRIVQRHPSSGPLWWLCARMLTAPDPLRAAWELADEIEADHTPAVIAGELPDGAVVCTVGWPDLTAEALIRRGDVIVLSVDGDGSGGGLVRQMERSGIEVADVPSAAIGTAAAAADLVLIEADAVSSGEALCPVGSRALAAAAYCAEVPVWLVAGIGRRLPEALWCRVAERYAESPEPWIHDHELVPVATVSHVVGPNGVSALTAANATTLLAPECPVAPELLVKPRI